MLSCWNGRLRRMKRSPSARGEAARPVPTGLQEGPRPAMRRVPKKAALIKDRRAAAPHDGGQGCHCGGCFGEGNEGLGMVGRVGSGGGSLNDNILYHSYTEGVDGPKVSLSAIPAALSRSRGALSPGRAVAQRRSRASGLTRPLAEAIRGFDSGFCYRHACPFRCGLQ